MNNVVPFIVNAIVPPLIVSRILQIPTPGDIRELWVTDRSVEMLSAFGSGQKIRNSPKDYTLQNLSLIIRLLV